MATTKNPVSAAKITKNLPPTKPVKGGFVIYGRNALGAVAGDPIPTEYNGIYQRS